MTRHVTLDSVEVVSKRQVVEASSSSSMISVRTGIIVSNPYSGEYEVTPTTEEQTLATAGKTLARDVVVAPIPRNYGLITYNGSVLTVS